jgi:hypothetical protein
LSPGRERALFWIGFALLCAIVFALAGRHLAVPGIYYDEVIQAEPAVRFLDADPIPHTIPGSREVRAFGRWFPVMTQPYMGALKSQLLIPVLAWTGPDAAKIRAITLAWSLLGLLALMLWLRRDFGLPVAGIAAMFVALDPGFLFVSRHDWGSFALGFICRCGALVLLSRGWELDRHGRGWMLGCGGVLLGLGVYNKIDFAIVVLGMAAALLIVRPGLFGEVRSRATSGAWFLGGSLVGSLPLLWTLGSTLTLTRQALARPSTSSDLAEKSNLWLGMLDGSYFHELMLAGGNFRTMLEHDGAASPFAALFLLAWIVLALDAFRRQRRGERSRPREFALLCALLIPVGLWFTPRAIRIHHALLAVPFPQLVVAIAAVDLWNRKRVWVRAGVVVGTVAGLGGSLYADFATLDTIRATGGKGRWSDSIGRFATDFAAAGEGTAVALDWGFALPMRFAARGLPIVEPIWELNDAHRLQRAWEHSGNARHRYVLFEPEYAVFRFGERFLEAVETLPAGQVAIERHRDGSGDPAFLSVQILGPHRIRYTGRFDIRLQSGGASP